MEIISKLVIVTWTQGPRRSKLVMYSCEGAKIKRINKYTNKHFIIIYITENNSLLGTSHAIINTSHYTVHIYIHVIHRLGLLSMYI